MKGYTHNMPNKVTKEPTRKTGTWSVKSGLAQMLKGGVIMDVVTADQAKIAEDAGAVAVMALERVPSDIRKAGGVARMADPTKITEIIESVSIPVMAKCRIGHFVEAQILESLDVDYIDESEVLTPADENNHINKTPFKVPFVCGARDLGEALRRIGEGAAMIRTKGEAGTGNIVEAVRHARSVLSKIKEIQGMDQSQLMAVARDLRSPFELVLDIKTGNGACMDTMDKAVKLGDALQNIGESSTIARTVSSITSYPPLCVNELYPSVPAPITSSPLSDWLT